MKRSAYPVALLLVSTGLLSIAQSPRAASEGGPAHVSREVVLGGSRLSFARDGGKTPTRVCVEVLAMAARCGGKPDL